MQTFVRAILRAVIVFAVAFAPWLIRPDFGFNALWAGVVMALGSFAWGRRDRLVMDDAPFVWTIAGWFIGGFVTAICLDHAHPVLDITTYAPAAALITAIFGAYGGWGLRPGRTLRYSKAMPRRDVRP